VRVKIIYNKNCPFPEEEEIDDGIIEVHYNYDGNGRTAFEEETTGRTIENKYIKEIEVKEEHSLKKYKEMWNEFIERLSYVNTKSYRAFFKKPGMTDLEYVNGIVEKIVQEYFPNPFFQHLKDKNK